MSRRGRGLSVAWVVVLVTIVLATLFVLTGCAKTPETLAKEAPRREERAAYRQAAFYSCMKSLPAGPVSTQYNDWDEVVSTCDNVSYYQMQTRYGQ